MILNKFVPKVAQQQMSWTFFKKVRSRFKLQLKKIAYLDFCNMLLSIVVYGHHDRSAYYNMSRQEFIYTKKTSYQRGCGRKMRHEEFLCSKVYFDSS